MPNTWAFLEELRTHRAELTHSEKPTRRYLLEAAYDTALSVFNELALTRCSSCSGFGHFSESCPTERKLSNLASVGGTHAEVLALAKKRVEEDWNNNPFNVVSVSLRRLALPDQPHRFPEAGSKSQKVKKR